MLGFSTAMARMSRTSVAEVEIEQIFQLVNQIDSIGISSTLQLYSWLTIEVVKARLVGERYPKHNKEEKKLSYIP